MNDKIFRHRCAWCNGECRAYHTIDAYVWRCPGCGRVEFDFKDEGERALGAMNTKDWKDAAIQWFRDGYAAPEDWQTMADVLCEQSENDGLGFLDVKLLAHARERINDA